ncbi:hypothetical protein [Mycobacterium persicum]|uniref:hypothetical protein n=1 Tax=Mycobacterium persicum TaxID=1487726 RepID=UPI0009F1D4A9|nr:hypothetical protein [Mycobacterium persicum]ORB40952.1 hypothetical protein BST40_21840 [Mycobacterium persicum]
MTAPRSPANHAHPRTRSMEQWRSRKAVMASRGETSGPRVDEADAALSWWRVRSFLIKEMDVTEARADALMDMLDKADAAKADAAKAEAVTTR